MWRRTILTGILLAISVVLGGPAVAVEAELEALPTPKKTGGRPLMQCLAERHSERAFAAAPLPEQVLSNLLWAAWGINRTEAGKRTAPSANNRQEIDLYVARADGLYLYDAAHHALQPVLPADVRAATGRQEYVGTAAVNLVYVADTTRMKATTEDQVNFYMGADTGFIAENVYLFCASEGLACCVRAMIDRDALAEIMGLHPEQRIVLAQSVGYPAPAAEETH
ncbi:MAG: SagB/ThcOx family dehydrogenase [Deinococcales bacterium]